jgi:predicted ATP-dependent endonuclease of OLD family
MSATTAPPEMPPLLPVRLACVQVSNFRRLAQTRLDLDEAITVLVGANNSGKTSLLTVLRNFLGDSQSFRAFDISLSQWPALRALGSGRCQSSCRCAKKESDGTSLYMLYP